MIRATLGMITPQFGPLIPIGQPLYAYLQNKGLLGGFDFGLEIDAWFSEPRVFEGVPAPTDNWRP